MLCDHPDQGGAGRGRSGGYLEESGQFSKSACRVVGREGGTGEGAMLESQSILIRECQTCTIISYHNCNIAIVNIAIT